MSIFNRPDMTLNDARQVLELVGKPLTPETVRASYRRLAKLHHPDVGGDAEKFKKVNTAYEVLKKVKDDGTFGGGGNPFQGQSDSAKARQSAAEMWEAMFKSHYKQWNENAFKRESAKPSVISKQAMINELESIVKRLRVLSKIAENQSKNFAAALDDEIMLILSRIAEYK